MDVCIEFERAATKAQTPAPSPSPSRSIYHGLCGACLLSNNAGIGLALGGLKASDSPGLCRKNYVLMQPLSSEAADAREMERGRRESGGGWK